MIEQGKLHAPLCRVSLTGLLLPAVRNKYSETSVKLQFRRMSLLLSYLLYIHLFAGPQGGI